MRHTAAVLLALAVMVLSGCACCGSSSPSQRNTGLWVAMYPVNRVLDVLDVVSFSAGLEGGLYADVHVTRAVQLGAGAGGGGSVGWWPGRQFGVGADYVSAAAFGPYSSEKQGYTRAGTAGVTDGTYLQDGLNTPTDTVHRKHRDYWAIGARVIAGIVGAEINVHPVEIADLVTGFFFVDFQGDDIGN